MKFVLQDNIFDFTFELYHQKEYYDWLNMGKSKDIQTEMIVCTKKELYNVCPDADLKEWCPVGSVEFCVDWYEKVWGKKPLPKNVPDELIPLCNRKIINMESSDEWITKIPSDNGQMFDNFKYFQTIPSNEIFRKDTKTIKSNWNGIVGKDIMRFMDGDHKMRKHFQVSEVISDIRSEWRCFVYNGQIMDIKNYDGDPFDIPNKNDIEYMIESYKSAPVSYTLDIAQTDMGTEIIEVHDFFACGLYGFSNNRFPFMLWRWFKEFTRNINNV